MRKRPGILHSRLKHECGLPATEGQRRKDNRVPALPQGTDWACCRFGSTDKELMMTSHKMARKTARKSPARKSARKAGSARRKPAAKKTSSRRWSQRVTEQSDALDLRQGVFKLTDPRKIAASLKRSAERSSRRKTGAYRSALSMLTFYINRAGKGLPKTQRNRLERAKSELKRQFGKE
jgi:hypothetical protein